MIDRNKIKQVKIVDFAVSETAIAPYKLEKIIVDTIAKVKN